MSHCEFCGRPAGVFRKRHPDCSEKNRKGRETLVEVARKTLAGHANFDDLQSKVAQLAEECFITPDQQRDLLVGAWEHGVEESLEDDLLTDEEESRLASLQQRFQLPQEFLDRKGALTRVVKAAVLRDLVNGKVPSKVTSPNLPFMLQKSEALVWVFPDTQFLLEKVRRHYEGRSAGVSIRICRGVYYRASAFKGYPVETTSTSHQCDAQRNQFAFGRGKHG